ncbi:hypothetical protein RFN25_04685 [Mesorhizobium abyssinicae]|uniref:hypothetical protein n=1 Tax=Mesorhizobium abyssinicae TaxID=1209958 RepID=UPI002A24B704|nr:hypothetical protein [Mesorhizobium abyssinicae]MDX8432731.1 hypothetical protein [Mesorhizobium abyssinicae]
MRFCFLTTRVGFLFYASVVSAADKTVHDQQNGFSLTFPEEWINEPLSEEEIRLSVKFADLICIVSASFYDQSAPGSPSDTGKFMEGWSMNNWGKTIGTSFSTADFSNDSLARFPDGYPVRLADVDFTVLSGNATFYGHSRFAFSVRGARYGYVNCGVMGESAEQVARMWAPLADKAERVVNSFILDTP